VNALVSHQISGLTESQATPLEITDVGSQFVVDSGMLEQSRSLGKFLLALFAVKVRISLKKRL
jgi:hypothetical protein